MMNEKNISSGTEEFLREAMVMVKLNHPCIVKLIGICRGPPLMLASIAMLKMYIEGSGGRF